jgi:hypothetical protein
MLLILSMIKTFQTFLDCQGCCEREVGEKEWLGVGEEGMIILKVMNGMVRESGWLFMDRRRLCRLRNQENVKPISYISSCTNQER